MPGEELPPWEEPGAVRRDSQPHRGTLLLLLGTAALVSGVLSPCVPGGCIPALVFGLLVTRMANTDRDKMAAGLMDPEGWEDADRGYRRGQFGIICGLAFFVPWGCITGAAVYQLLRAFM
jgi:hypothetical protein